MTDTCDRCGAVVEEIPDDGVPIFKGHDSETKEVPAAGEPSDPAFVQRFDTVTVETPRTGLVCNDCLTDDDTEFSDVPSEAFQTRTRPRGRL